MGKKLITILFLTLSSICFAQSGQDSITTNSKTYNYWGQEELRLIERGQANLYVYKGVSYDNEGVRSKYSNYYYNIGNGSLKKAKMKNLKVDFKEHPQTMIHLRKVNKFRWIAGSIGIGSLVGGLITGIPYFKGVFIPSAPAASPSPGLFIGAGIALLANFSFILAPKQQEAIYIYNGHEIP